MPDQEQLGEARQGFGESEGELPFCRTEGKLLEAAFEMREAGDILEVVERQVKAP
jgi:hypothetical protein